MSDEGSKSGSLEKPLSKPAEAENGKPVPVETKQTESIPQVDGAAAVTGDNLQEPEYDVQVKLSDIQADPNNPLYSVKSFEDLGLSKEILSGLAAMSFRRPSKIQEKALPLLMIDPPQNMIGQSQSGTGKTAAFVLNILHRIDVTGDMAKTPQALVLAPSRELARQIVGVIEVMGQQVPNLTVSTSVPMESQRNKKVESAVVVGTPGTVQDQVRRRLLNPTKLKVLVLDEADNMLDQQGLGDQCIRVKQYALNYFVSVGAEVFLPKNIQIVLFSATFPDNVVRYAKVFAPNANEITLKHEELTVEGIKQLYLDCDSEEQKYDTLVKFYGLLTIGSSIIFVKTRQSAAEIEKRMTAEGHTVASLTGGVEGSLRDEVIDRFRSGEAKVLITTNVLARGIDVQTVSMVINYDIPTLHSPRSPQPIPDCQTYLHRIGRTGRFGRVGVAVSFVANKEDWDLLQGIANYFQCEIQRVDSHDWDDVEKVVKQVIKSSRAGVNLK
ncbi:RNA helicase required for poly(A+) mRNA export [Ascosphaera aggregata]|nr:RNA helicase required for poly(A+) mRNA export [Ascosphaera aggregata]